MRYWKKSNGGVGSLEAMKRTYIDANVLIAAFQGDEIISRRAMEVLDDPNRRLVVSDLLRLEVLPKPTFHKRSEEVEFINEVLKRAAEDVPCDHNVTNKAVELASKYDLAPMDALHVGAALTVKADEFVTTEKPTKPLCKVSEMKVTSLYPSESGKSGHGK
jgi:predicted nucleic acid-binding protein